MGFSVFPGVRFRKEVFILIKYLNSVGGNTLQVTRVT